MQIRYGKDILNLGIDTADILSLDYSKSPLSLEKIVNILNNESILMEGIEEVIAHSNHTLIILPDITRKSGAEIFIPYLFNIFEQYNKSFNIIFAIGTHRSLTEDEKKLILTEQIYEKYSHKIIDHNPDDVDSHFYFGKTRNNTPILINNAYLKADTIIPIGSVSYHYFAGFGGGRKLIIPGIAARKTALHNHKLVLDEENRCKNRFATTANLKNNPVHNDLVEAIMIARRGKTFFSINTILNDNNEIIDLTCGDLFTAHIEACEKLKQYTSIRVGEKYNNVIVSAGGFPKDINMVQAQKSLDRITNIVKDGGNIFFFAECKDGYGNEHFKNFFDLPSSKEMFNRLLFDYQINRQTAYNLRSITERFNCYLFSGFNEEDTKRMGFIKLKSIDEIKNLIKNQSLAIVPTSYNYLFVID
ncbi:MAG: nickel-dependent lactate racemase [Calditerrivibrio sp.]|nr:nickel-dependent lactate racemase [Calditerrivibrio sp.]